MERIRRDGRVCVLELELEGALAVQREVSASVTVFIAADVPELERRLRERATESTGEIGERIELARRQLEQAHLFRYMVRNDDLERATAVLAAIVERELELAGVATGSMSGP
jgi:guanylate kinase